MKTIGLLGGMSWESTELYYRLINEGVKSRMGSLHSAKIAIVSQEHTVVPLFDTTVIHAQEAVSMALI